ncbi:MAG: penicillin-binding protein 2 [Bacteroidota bacterium]
MKNNYSDRRVIIGFIFTSIAVVYILRLFIIQVIFDEYKINADNNVLRYVTIYPDRGLIFDRHGKPLVENEISYDLLVTPRLVKELDTLELCNILSMTKADFYEKFNKASKYSRHKASIFEKEISKQTYAKLQEKLFKFKGFHIERRTVRKYPKSIAAHILGYIGEVSQATVDKNPYYKSGDYIGISGIEKAYEDELRGKRGLKIQMVDVFNRVKGSFKNGRYDTLAVSGYDLYTSIDADLQEYGEKLMQNKRGSIVAIDPSTGEILAMVSSPTFNPNDFVGREFSKNYGILSKDINKPLMNRALIAQYPPGSTFKLINALIGQQMGVLHAETRYPCSLGFHVGGLNLACHEHPSPQDLLGAVQISCNSYFCYAFWSMIDKSGYKTTEEAFNVWRKHVVSFGFGKRFDDDLPSELNGNIPTASYYDRFHGKGRWKALSIISIAIGQGEILLTPLQLANQAAIFANRGYYYTPHIIQGFGANRIPHPKFIKKHYTTIDEKYFDIVVEGMHRVIQSGTGRGAQFDSIQMAGKTGTAQNPHGEDHSIFVLFAPLDKPKIAISVIIENGGFGATWGCPIASLMVEKYLNDTIKRPELEKKMFEGVINYNAPKKKK